MLATVLKTWHNEIQMKSSSNNDLDAGSSVWGPNNFYNESVGRRLPQLNPSKPNVRTKNAGDDDGEKRGFHIRRPIRRVMGSKADEFG